jgi:hypothetical protein
MINRITIDGVEYETVLVAPDNIKPGSPCVSCDFYKLPFSDEPCKTCYTHYIWRDSRICQLRKVTKTK